MNRVPWWQYPAQIESTTPVLQKLYAEPMKYKSHALTTGKVYQESTETKRTKYWISLEAKILTAHPKNSIYSIMAESIMRYCIFSMKDRSLLIKNPSSSKSRSHISIAMRYSLISLATLLAKNGLSLQVRWNARQIWSYGCNQQKQRVICGFGGTWNDIGSLNGFY